MARRVLAVLALALAASAAYLAIRTDGGRAGAPAGGDAAPASSGGTGPGLAAMPRSPAVGVATSPSPWWLEAQVESLDPTLRSARLEARWWPTKPSPPYEGAAAVFPAEAALIDGKARVRVTGDARPGWAVLFVVESGADGERRRLAYPWFAEPAGEVAAGRGSSILDRPVLLGARSLRLRALDREDRAVPGLEVEVLDPGTSLRQVEATGPDGRVRFDALAAAEVQVRWRAGASLRAGGPLAGPPNPWPERHGEPYADGALRPIGVTADEIVLRVPRRALLRVRGRVAGAPEDAWLPVDMFSLSTNRPGRNLATTANGASHGIWLDPGPYRAGSVTTPALEADQETTVDLPMSLAAGQGWLDVGFDVRALPGDDRVACAVEARWLPGGAGWRGGQATAPHDRALLLLLAGTYEVTGAVRTGGVVRFSAPRQVEVRAGEGTSVTLATAPAGAVRLAGPRHRRECEVVERAFPATGAVAAASFRFAWVWWPEETSTWWLPAGAYVLRQFEDSPFEDEPGMERRLPFEVRAGVVTELVQDGSGWFAGLPR